MLSFIKCYTWRIYTSTWIRSLTLARYESIPIRYLHSSFNVIQLKSVETRSLYSRTVQEAPRYSLTVVSHQLSLFLSSTADLLYCMSHLKQNQQQQQNKQTTPSPPTLPHTHKNRSSNGLMSVYTFQNSLVM